MKKYTEQDVSDELVRNIEFSFAENKNILLKRMVAESWNHYPDKLTWRWDECNNLYVGEIMVACYQIRGTSCVNAFVPTIRAGEYETEQKAREVCEKIAEEFINQLTSK